ncbi:MAG TPA: hypothetical protein VNA16_06720 [Abditibacteriaceae bacterium]|nr:hypothetical protein [Abditibacteriaceae bacterium]
MTERKETDRLETLTAARLSPDDQTDSPSSESDAGLDDPVIEDQGPINTGQSVRGAFDIDAELPARPIEEIPMSDLDDGMEDDFLMSPELADMNVPGEVDIEELDDDALDNTDLPEDARLDRLEE